MSNSFFKSKVIKDPKTGYCLLYFYFNGEARTLPFLDIPYDDYIRDRKDEYCNAHDTYKWFENHLEEKAQKLVKKSVEHIPTQMCRYLRSILPERTIDNMEEFRFAKTKRKEISSLKKHVNAFKRFCEENEKSIPFTARYCDPYVLIETDSQDYIVQSREAMKLELLNAVEHNDLSYYEETVPQIWDEVISDPGIPVSSLVAKMLEIWSLYWEKSINYEAKDQSLLELKDFFKGYIESSNVATDAYNFDTFVFGILIQSVLVLYTTEPAIDEYLDLLFDENPDKTIQNGFIITPIL